MQEEHTSQGLCSFMDYNYKSALEYFNKSLEIQKNSEVYLYRGITNLKLGNYEASISDLNKSEQDFDENNTVFDKFDIYFNRGLAYLYNSEISNAKRDLETAKPLAKGGKADEVYNYLSKLE